MPGNIDSVGKDGSPNGVPFPFVLLVSSDGVRKEGLR